MQFCFFDDEIANNFLPLTLTRPTDDLRVGILTIKEKWSKWLVSKQISRITHSYLKENFPSSGINENELCIWLNSRCIPTKNVVEAILDLNPGEALFYDKAIIAIKSDGKQSNRSFKQNEIPSFTKRINLAPPYSYHLLLGFIAPKWLSNF